MQLFKYIVHNSAHQAGQTATFMPKPLVGDNGSGMHCHLSLFKQGINLFAGENYEGLSDMALYYIGGILQHARALMLSLIPAPTPISVLWKVMKRQHTWPILHAIVRLRFVFQLYTKPK